MSTVSSSSLPSVSECSSPNTVSAHSEPESDTSDYPRNTPSPATRRPPGARGRPGRLNDVQRAVLPRRRATIPPPALPGEETGSQSTKKLRLESSSPGPQALPSPALCPAADCDCNVKALPKNNKSECESQKCVGGHFTANHLKTETDEMKMEIAKIDSILQGKLLLEKSSHKLCEMVGLDCQVKQEYESSDEKKTLQLSHIKHEQSCKVEREEVNSSSSNNNNNNNNKRKIEKDFQLSKEEGVRCQWSGCGARLEVQNLLDHLSVSHLVQTSPVLHLGSTDELFQSLFNFLICFRLFT